MMMDCITVVGLFLATFGFGVTVGKLIEKFERISRKMEDQEYKREHKNNRP